MAKTNTPIVLRIARSPRPPCVCFPETALGPCLDVPAAHCPYCGVTAAATKYIHLPVRFALAFTSQNTKGPTTDPGIGRRRSHLGFLTDEALSGQAHYNKALAIGHEQANKVQHKLGTFLQRWARAWASCA